MENTVPDPTLVDEDPPGPAHVRTRQDFARELTFLRDRSGMTVRQVAATVGAQSAHSTIGDWFAGRGLPSTTSRVLFVRVLNVCGVHDPELIEQWLQAWQRVRRAPGRRPGRPEPYRGLASFQPEDAEWFFGRDTLTSDLITRLAGLHSRGGGVQVVVGPSGSGKSSLLRAGMIPAVRAGRAPGSAAWPVVLFTPGSRPVDELAAQLAGCTGRPAGEIAATMRADAFDPGVLGGTLVVVVDQFEEVFTTCSDHAERRMFIEALTAAASAGALVVIGLRADFYAQALRHPRLVAAIQQNQLAVAPMSDAQLREAIVEPARKAKLEIEDGLVDMLLRDIAPLSGPGERSHDAGALPLLSHALYTTWSHGQGRRLTIAHYREVGGVDGAVAASASKVYDELTGDGQELARRLFLGLVHVAPDTADTRRRVATSELFSGYGDAQAQQLEDVLDRFIAQRLVTADVDTVEISHEALLTAWPRLRAWLDNDRAGLIVSRRIGEAAATWQREHRDPAALLRGTRLAAAREWVDAGPAGHSRDLTPLAREFLAASVQRELDEQAEARRSTRRLRRLVAGLVVLFLLTGAAGAFAVRSQRIAGEQRDNALSGKVANEATALRVVNPALAAQLSLASYRLAPTAPARGSLMSSFAIPYANRLTDHTLAVYAAVFSPGGHVLATAGLDHRVYLYDVKDKRRPVRIASLDGHSDSVTAAVFSPDGRTLATAGNDRTARLWDVTDPRHPKALATLSGHTSVVRRVSFSPDGRILATAGYDRTARLWDISDPRQGNQLATLTGHRDPVGIAAFSPDGRTLITGGGNNPVRLWDVTDARNPQPGAELLGHTDRVLTAVFAPGGRLVATGSFDATVRLWDVTDPRRPVPAAVLAGHRNGTIAIAFSPDRRLLATGSYDTTVRLWDISDPKAVSTPVTLQGHADTVFAVGFSPDGETLATGGQDNTARLWDVHGYVLAGNSGGVGAAEFSPDGSILATGGHRNARLWDVADSRHPTPLATLTGHTDGVGALAFTPDRRILATGSLDYTVRLWDISDPRRPTSLATLSEHTNNVFAVAFSPDGRILATAGGDQAIRLWDVTDPRLPVPLTTITEHQASVVSAGFSPDGRTLATASADHTVRLWDVTDPRRYSRLASLTGHTQNVFRVAFSPDGKLLASAGADHTVRLWDVADPRHPGPLSVLTGHTNSVNGIAFGPAGRTLASAGSDHTVRLWDVTHPRRVGPPATLSGHTDILNSVAYSPDGRTIASAGGDATVRLWDTDIDHIAGRICAVAHPRITAAEWSQYFADLPYDPPCR